MWGPNLLIAFGFGLGVILTLTGFAKFGEIKLDLAAWVQAVGSVAGIFIAIAVPAWLDQRVWRRSEADRKVKTRTLAMLIAPSLLSLQKYIADLRTALSEEHNYENAFACYADPAKFFEEMRLHPGEALIASTKDLHLFGEHLGGDLTQILAFIAGHNSDVEWVAKTPVMQNWDTVARLMRRIEIIDRLLIHSLAEIERLHDSPTTTWQLRSQT